MTALVFRVQYDTSLIIAWFLSCQPHCPYLKYIFKRIKVLLSTFHFLIFDEVWPSDIEAFWFFRKKRRKKSERNLCVFFFFFLYFRFYGKFPSMGGRCSCCGQPPLVFKQNKTKTCYCRKITRFFQANSNRNHGPNKEIFRVLFYFVPFFFDFFSKHVQL